MGLSSLLCLNAEFLLVKVSLRIAGYRYDSINPRGNGKSAIRMGTLLTLQAKGIKSTRVRRKSGNGPVLAIGEVCAVCVQADCCTRVFPAFSGKEGGKGTSRPVIILCSPGYGAESCR